MEFEILKDLVVILTVDKIKKIEVLGNGDDDGGLLHQLYNGILEGEFSSDEEAAVAIYGEHVSKNEYRKLRVRLIRQLINISFFVDSNQPMFNDRTKAFYNCQRDFAAANVLAMRNAPKASVFLLKQVLEQVVKFEFTEMAAEVTRQLRVLHSRHIMDIAEYEKFSTLHRKYEEKRRLEVEAFEKYEYLLRYYMAGKSNSKDLYIKTGQHYQEMQEVVDKVDTTKFYFYMYSVGLAHYMSVNDYRSALDIAEKGISVLLLRNNYFKSELLSFVVQKLICLTQLRVSDENVSNEIISLCNNLVFDGHSNWYVVKSSQIHYFYYSRRYQDALNLMRQSYKNHRFSLLTGQNAEIWTIYAGYLYLLSALGALSKSEVVDIVGPFKRFKFENSFQVLNKEKVGMNIPILLLPVILSIVEGRFQDFGHSVEALKKYRLRYLENDINQRSACFMKMLLALSEMQHAPEVARKKIQVELEKLKQEPIEMSRQSYAIEVIPYDDLWALITQKIGYPELSGTGQ